MMTAGQSQACASGPRLSQREGSPLLPGKLRGFFYVHVSMVDFLTTLKYKHVLLCLIETLQQMFYDFSIKERKKKRMLESASIVTFMGELH